MGLGFHYWYDFIRIWKPYNLCSCSHCCYGFIFIYMISWFISYLHDYCGFIPIFILGIDTTTPLYWFILAYFSTESLCQSWWDFWWICTSTYQRLLIVRYCHGLCLFIFIHVHMSPVHQPYLFYIHSSRATLTYTHVAILLRLCPSISVYVDQLSVVYVHLHLYWYIYMFASTAVDHIFSSWFSCSYIFMFQFYRGLYLPIICWWLWINPNWW